MTGGKAARDETPPPYETHGQWPARASALESRKPLYHCPGCGAMSSAPINHDHSKSRRSH